MDTSRRVHRKTFQGRLGSCRGVGVDSLFKTRLRESGILMLGENFIYGLPCLSLDFECNWFAWLYYSRFFFSWEEGGGGERTPVPGMLSGMRSCWTDALPAGFSSREVLVAVRAVRFRA